jgi:hypothetical protein
MLCEGYDLRERILHSAGGAQKISRPGLEEEDAACCGLEGHMRKAAFWCFGNCDHTVVKFAKTLARK